MSQSLSQYLKRINWKDATSLVFVALLLFVVIKMLTGGLFGISLVVIENGPKSSMWPTYDQGDMFIVYKAKPENIYMGDVIVYRTDLNPYIPDKNKMLIIHRVINITIINGEDGAHYYYRVSGDNPISNNYVDSYNMSSTLIPYEAVLGKTVLLIPKVGYLRLWLSSNPFIQYLFLGILIAILLYLIFSPEENEKQNGEDTAKKEKGGGTENKDEKEKLTLKEKVIRIFKDKKKRMKIIIYSACIIALLIGIPTLDAIISHRDLQTGISDIEFLQAQPYNSENIYFLAYRIHFQHDGSWNKVFKEFKVNLIQNGEVISTMSWYSFYQKEGDLTIGGSFIVPMSSFNVSQEFTISTSYTIHLRFGQDYSGIYNETF
ncbi:MAG: signal peptidase I, partial [Candidatus Heimdallarchaeaceae archaeon]